MTLDALSPVKRFLVVAASVLAVALSLVGLPSLAAQAAVAYGGVEVVDSEGDPVTGMGVLLSGGETVYLGTGADGRARISDHTGEPVEPFEGRVSFTYYPVGSDGTAYVWNGTDVVEGESGTGASALFDPESTTLLELELPVDQPDGAITGTVSLNPAPSSSDWQASVSVYDAETGDYLTSVETGPSGTYAVRGLPSRTYKIQFLGHVTGTGIDYRYATRWYQNKNSYASATVVSVGTSTVSNINQTLNAMGVVKGLLGDTTGMEGPAVAFFPTTGTPDWDSSDIFWALTWDDQYEIQLPSGSYRVAFGDRVTGESSGGDEIDYDFTPKEYWDGSANLGGATVLTLSPGQTRVINGLDAPSFPDVPSQNQFGLEITWLASTGITTGYSDGSFRPLDQVRRDAMAAFLYRFAGSPAFTPPTTSPFLDVTPSTQFYKEITWLASTGISTGWDVPGGKEFRPLSTVNRDAMAAFLYRFVESPDWDAPSTSPFSDVPTTRQFYDEITWLANTGVTTGYPDGTFRPLNSVARDAMAAFLYRLDDLDL